MAADGTVMGGWHITTCNGSKIFESDGFLWPAVKAVVTSLSYTTDYGHTLTLEGHLKYGFQRYTVTTADGVPIQSGAQLIGVDNGTFRIIEINESGRVNKNTVKPLSELTYAKELLKTGC